MKKAGYPAAFAAAITAVSSTIGGIIPPSIMMIVLANAGGISVGALFSAGIIPGLMIGFLLMLINYIIAKRNNFEKNGEPFSLKALAISLYKSSFALLIPIVLVGSVVYGIAGVVEAGALIATIALFVGLFVYRTITWENCKGAFIRAFRNSAMVFIIIAASGPFSWLLTSLGAISDLEQWLLSYTHSPLLFILVLVVFICLLGMVMDSAANIIVVGPVHRRCDGQSGLPRCSGGAGGRGGFSHRFCYATGGGRFFYLWCHCKCAFRESSSGYVALFARTLCSFVRTHRCASVHHVFTRAVRVCEMNKCIFLTRYQGLSNIQLQSEAVPHDQIY